MTWVVGVDPDSIGVGEFVVQPEEGAGGGVGYEGRGLPVDAEGLVSGGVGPVDYREGGEAEPWGDAVVGVVHPGGCPDQVAAEAHEPRAVRWIDAVEQRVRVVVRRIGRVRP